MINITSRLWSFWSQFECNGLPVPAFQEGAVPDGTPFPYITFSPAKAAAFGLLPTFATVWVKYTGENSSEGIAQRIAILDAVGRAIPEAGVRLDLPDGFMILTRGTGDFLIGDTDPDDKTILVGRILYGITYYTT